MNRDYYLGLAASGLRMPIGADLVLHERRDAATLVFDGAKLGRVIEDAALRYRTPLAFPLMDLKLEKADLLAVFGVPEDEVDGFHFDAPVADDLLLRASGTAARPFSQRHRAQFGAIRYIEEDTDLFPLGIVIGPFSLMTKLMSDPISAVALAAMGFPSVQDPAVQLAEQCLQLAEGAVLRSVRAQIHAGARAIIVCEPAANRTYVSPRQMESGSNVFEHFVIDPNLKIKELLNGARVDLVFHDCGDVTDGMVERIASKLNPAILSLGSSRNLWEIAPLVSKRTVLFGNLPTRNFYSDAAMPDERVAALTVELVAKMQQVQHPHIVGSECDVLHVDEAAEAIRRKIGVMMSAGRTAAVGS
jgi:hypothetical protein